MREHSSEKGDTSDDCQSIEDNCHQVEESFRGSFPSVDELQDHVVAPIPEDLKVKDDEVPVAHDEKLAQTKTRPKADYKDRGYAWVIMGICFYLSTMCSGTFTSYGVFLPDYVEYFGVSKAKAAVVGSLGLGIGNLLGVVMGPIVHWVGYRRAVLGACLLTSTSLACSAATSNLYVLYVTHGILPGLGLGFYSVCTMIAIMDYFEKRRSLALGINTCGLSVGIFIIPQVIRFLLDKYTWKGTLLIYGGYQLNGLVAGLLLRPPPRPKRKTDLEPKEKPLQPSKTKQALEEEDKCKEDHTDENVSNGLYKQILQMDNEMLQSELAISSLSLKSKDCSWRNFFDFSILLNPKAVLLFFSITCSIAGHFVPFVFLPARVISYNVDKTKATFLVSIMGICSGVGRPLVGLVADYLPTYRPLIMTASSFAVGTICAVSYIITDYVIIAVIFGLAGALSAGYMALFGAVLGDILPEHQLPQGTGFLLTFFGIGVISSPALAGSLVDKTGNYATPFLVFGLVELVGGVLTILVFVLQQRDRSRKRHLEEEKKEVESHGWLKRGLLHHIHHT